MAVKREPNSRLLQLLVPFMKYPDCSCAAAPNGARQIPELSLEPDAIDPREEI